MKVEIMWGEPRHVVVEVPDDFDNWSTEEWCRTWVEVNHPDFDSWDWKRVPDDA